jgi:hypothetical protein
MGQQHKRATQQSTKKPTKQHNNIIFACVNYINNDFGGAREVTRIQDSQQWCCEADLKGIWPLILIMGVMGLRSHSLCHYEARLL